ncbi:MAG: SGNH/GDSL hydrolase family protein [Blautia sp.]|nr:SGNH/GDSL hydrolase family protein [Lachnoclostridium sp.]MCM1210998.1 SGNH/GDSL hydrolase family protein [Blautia sp.]
MENKNNAGKGFNGKIILFAIMIVFCILALIEIIYGRVQLQAARKQLEQLTEQENAATSDTPEEIFIEEPDKSELGNQIQEEPDYLTVSGNEPSEDVAGIQEETPETAKEPEEDTRKYDMQIVFMGDSILDNARGDGGVADLIGVGCNAQVYNMAMGGTTAALLPDERYDFNRWDSRSLLGVVNAVIGNIDGSCLEGYRAGEILEECDFSKTDYFIIEYGINDFFSQLPNNRYLSDGVTLVADDAHTYVGALELAVNMLHGSFPDAKIIVCKPHYCQFFDAEVFVGDSYSMNTNYGPLVSYGGLCDYVYEQHKQQNVLLYDALENSGINAYTADEYLEDGIHLSAEGRRAYAEPIIQKILADFYPTE